MEQRQGAVEKMVSAFWKNKRVFVTGHTGFKGAWLTAILKEMGADVTGYALAPPTQPSLFEQLALEKSITHIEADVTDRRRVAAAVETARPEILFHMAAQSLVRHSYRHPLETFDTNVTGTLNVLEAARHSVTLKSLVIVTTDKCYLNDDGGRPFAEGDALGGNDPYSASKAAAEMVTHAYYRSFLKEKNIPTASARAGNVIGGGDWAEDRLIPDIAAAAMQGRPARIRNPKATRPWQFVLEPLNGYLMLAEMLYAKGHLYAGGWNFGPEAAGVQPVENVVRALQAAMPFAFAVDETPQPAEAALLALDIGKAKARLGWQPRLSFEEAVAWTGHWYRDFAAGKPAADLTLAQIGEYFGLRGDARRAV